MARVLEGKPAGKGLRIALVASRFNSFVTDKLLAGALDALARTGVEADAALVVRVPGSFEIPLTAKKLADSGRFDGVVCLGAIIKGETAHWDYLSQAVTHAVAQASLSTGVPMTLGILTTETREAALARAGERGDNRGFDAGMAVVELANLYRSLRSES